MIAARLGPPRRVGPQPRISCGGAEAGRTVSPRLRDQEPGDADDHADLARVRRRITGEALADARTALDTDQLPTQGG